MQISTKGFSLVQVMIVGALLSGLSVVFLQVMKNVSMGQQHAKTIAEEIELENSIRAIINDHRYCRVSLAGKKGSGMAAKDSNNVDLPAVTFDKADVDNGQVEVTKGSSFTELSEGLDIELWYTDQTGERRTVKQFNGADNINGIDKSQFGSLKIKSMKLVFFNANSYSEGVAPGFPFIDPAQLVVLVQKKISKNNFRDFIIPIKLNVSGLTVDVGTKKSTLYSCRGLGMGEAFLNPISSRWSDWNKTTNPKLEAENGEYVCGIESQSNCDFNGSTGGCIRLKYCSP